MPTQRPIGFSPSEISALVNDEVLYQHAEEAAFLWSLRDQATSEPHYALKDLASLDERVEAHLDGLRVAGTPGWKLCEKNLAENQAPGEVFVMAFLAFESGDRDRMLEALREGVASRRTRRGLVSALAWLDPARVTSWIERLLDARSPLHRAVGLAASAAHRIDPGTPVVAAIEDAEPVLRARGLRTAGEVKRLDLRNEVRRSFEDVNDECRFWAAWSGTLLGVKESIPRLMLVAETIGPFRERALHVALRATDLDDTRQWIRRVAQRPESAKLAILGMGILGDPASIPWLISKMNVKELARASGEAFSMITGADLSFDDLDQDSLNSEASQPPFIDEELALDTESNLRWPDPDLVSGWWERHRPEFTFGTRYLAGKPVSEGHARQVLRRGKQRQRAAAALELALLNVDQPLFEVRAPVRRQRQQLGTWTS